MSHLHLWRARWGLAGQTGRLWSRVSPPDQGLWAVTSGPIRTTPTTFRATVSSPHDEVSVLPENHQDRKGAKTRSAGEASGRMPGRTSWDQPRRQVAWGPLGAQLTTCCRNPAPGGLTTDSRDTQVCWKPFCKTTLLPWDKPILYTVECFLLLRLQLFPGAGKWGNSRCFLKGSYSQLSGLCRPQASTVDAAADNVWFLGMAGLPWPFTYKPKQVGRMGLTSQSWPTSGPEYLYTKNTSFLLLKSPRFSWNVMQAVKKGLAN